ncbi:MAG: polysaccharide pyruvyl transferase family protein [Clostridium sp.]|nr:polysaccharide pyruvyl transferase family protein [Clostridium sp.]
MRVGFVGPFGDTNFGDYAMLVNNMYYIRPTESVVFTYSLEGMKTICKRYLSDFNVKTVLIKNNYSFTPQYGESYSVEYDDAVLSSEEILCYISNQEELQSEIKLVDILFVCGGGYFNRVWSAKHRKGKLLSIMAVIISADRAGKKIIFGGNTYGPFDESGKLYAAFFSSLKNVVLASRDNVFSEQNLRKIGVDSSVYLLPDDLYFLDNELKMRESSFTDYVATSKYIILELYASISELKSLLSDIHDFVITMKQKYSLDVVFVPLDTMYGGEEQAIFLKDRIPELKYFDFGNLKYRQIEDVQCLVKNAEFVICQRYHLFCFAMANNTPAINILKNVCGDKRYYYSKIEGLLRQIFPQREYKQDLFMANDISDCLKQMKENLCFVSDLQKRFFDESKQNAEKIMSEKRKMYFNLFF